MSKFWGEAFKGATFSIAKNPIEVEMKAMAEKLTTYDPAAALVDDTEIAFFMADVPATGNSSYIAKCVGIVSRAKGMAETASQTGLSR